MKTPYLVTKAENWQQARILADSLDANWVFRGQADATWSLTTKLHREAEKYRRDSNQWRYLERWMLLEFQRGAQHYHRDLPADRDHFGWLALMQHYGVPTRLLDFTHSFYVAAFFAMEARPSKETKEAAVWAINCNVLNVRAKAAKIDGLEIRLDGENRHNCVNKLIDDNINIANEPNKPFVLAVEPHRSDARLMAQQAVFMFPSEISASFYENFSGMLGVEHASAIDAVQPVGFREDLIPSCHDENMDTIKIHLPYSVPDADNRAHHSEAYAIMRDLKKMNITAQTLFPGPDGFARSMGYYLRHYSEV
jgi:hypothetical protein